MSENTAEGMDQVRLVAFVSGRVQGVGFRWWTRCQALELGLVGSATNYPDGRVCVVAEGPQVAAEELLRRLRGETVKTPGKVDVVVEQWLKPKGLAQGFTMH